MNQKIPPVMTFAQCQNILHVGKNTLLELLHTGKLQGFKIGPRWRITVQNCNCFLSASALPMRFTFVQGLSFKLYIFVA